MEHLKNKLTELEVENIKKEFTEMEADIKAILGKYAENYAIGILALQREAGDDNHRHMSVMHTGCAGCLMSVMLQHRKDHPEFYSDCPILKDFLKHEMMATLQKMATNPTEIKH